MQRRAKFFCSLRPLDWVLFNSAAAVAYRGTGTLDVGRRRVWEGLGERCKLSQLGLEWSPSRNLNDLWVFRKQFYPISRLF